MKFFNIASLLMLAASANAFSVSGPARNQVAQASIATSTQLYNVPPPSATEGDPADIKDAANRESPPQSFYQLQINCARAAELAIKDGHRLIEVEVRYFTDVKKSLVAFCSNLFHSFLHSLHKYWRWTMFQHMM